MNSNFELKSRIFSFYYAFVGIREFFFTQVNALIHLLGLCAMITLGFYFKVSNTEWLILIIVSGIVFIAEMLNTAIEFLTDLISPGFNERAGKVKYVAAGAVLVSAIMAVVVGGIIFIPKI